jgi:putative lipoprotein (rSAM/lipoprotein system)
MAHIHLKFLKSTNALIVLLISILGFSTSCKEEDQARMYGSPHADFIIKGNIVSAADNNPIPDIIVEMRIVQKIVGEQDYIRLAGTGFSGDNGDYRVKDNSGYNLTYQLKYTDTDGALNGQYETLDTTIVFKDPIFTGGDGQWYSGYVEKEVDIKLKPKK